MNLQDLVIKISLWSKPLSRQTNWSITQGKNTWFYWIVLPPYFQILNHISDVGPIHVIWISHIHRRQMNCISQDSCCLCVTLMHEGCPLPELMQKQSSHPSVVSCWLVSCVTAGEWWHTAHSLWHFHSRSFTSPKEDEKYLCLSELTSSPLTLSWLLSCARDRFSITSHFHQSNKIIYIFWLHSGGFHSNFSSSWEKRSPDLHQWI